MASYGVVFQILALVQWRARAQANYAWLGTQLSSVSHSAGGSQAEPDWQWIRVCPADSGADLCDCQWPSPEHNAASLQLPSGQLGLNDCICAGDRQQFISSNLKLRPTWKFPPSTWNLAAATCNKSMRWIQAVTVQLNNSPHWPPSTLKMARPEEVEHLEAGAPNPRHPAVRVPRYRRTYHEIREIIWLWYQKLLISQGLIMAYVLWYHEQYQKILISQGISYDMYMIL
jgi:hypothetical protein